MTQPNIGFDRLSGSLPSESSYNVSFLAIPERGR